MAHNAAKADIVGDSRHYGFGSIAEADSAVEVGLDPLFSLIEPLPKGPYRKECLSWILGPSLDVMKTLVGTDVLVRHSWRLPDTEMPSRGAGLANRRCHQRFIEM